jgi:topoisomerase-4 subunit A
VAEVKVVDEPVTVVVSDKGWVRARTGHGHDPASFAFKAGDGLYGTFECRTVDTLLVFGNKGRVYSVPVSMLPGARGDGQPVTTLIDLEPGTQLLVFRRAGGCHAAAGGSGGYGFLATVEQMSSRLKAGKAFISVWRGRTCCHPCGLRVDRRAHPELRDRRAQCHGQRRARPQADRPRGQGHAGRARRPTPAVCASTASGVVANHATKPWRSAA